MNQPFDAVFIGNTKEDRKKKADAIIKLAKELDLEAEFDEKRLIIIIKIPDFDVIDYGG